MKLIEKSKFVEKLQKHKGNISRACLSLNIERATFYRWYKEDAEFRQKIDDVTEQIIDEAETSLQNMIENGDVTATIFFLKTKGKKRGYTEKKDLALSSNDASLKIEILDNKTEQTNGEL